ncbi:unnamed protein product [Rotaria magnacalcarata]|uniref:ADP ribosyltransferase domain-containing protein n=1 Tax=Rotaria magnacalcarata TaxID=392030 RepID=A0A816R8R9_9BILA|nr:unnamed protein product [Rotaria magnacalcarata]CAF1672443.1 unnamed protein product [Rotaria magnacalcarata]CAF2069592.1 unnamed protein product [Rotaria magnacalcarata]CAF4106060.1 unnamed protein product [Rotaria magnacalcarata]CAF4122001.1 unnamed protein product [Rotaria magnacalcarata]
MASLSIARRRLITIILNLTARTRSIFTRNSPSNITKRTRRKTDLEELREQIDSAGDYDLHDILRQQNRLEWPEWHWPVNENDKITKIVENFHRDFNKMKESSSIVGLIRIIEDTWLHLMDDNDKDWSYVKACFKQARELDDPLLILKALIDTNKFSRCLNRHSAANIYHALKLYCTLLNCPVLARTQEYTEAFTKILFHPKLKNLEVQNITVYRGMVLEDEKPIANCKVGGIIITTTFLSTSANQVVAEMFGTTPPESMISVFCTYKIRSTTRRTALKLQSISKFPEEEEILLMRFIPFKIVSVERTEDGRKIEIFFDEFTEHEVSKRSNCYYHNCITLCEDDVYEINGGKH